MQTIHRRHLMLAGAATAGMSLRRAAAQTAAPAAPPADPSYPFSLPALPYAPAANEPHVDRQTMEIHHGKHHAAYVANLNAAVKDHAQVAAMPLSAMMAKLAELPEGIRTAVRNNGGGHANHTMFWTLMGGKGGEPSGTLADAIKRDFGSLDALQQAFNKAGAGRFGSGWVMVTVDRPGKLALATTPNQDTPLMDGKTVLFGNDVWEHAYYLKYQNRRPDYLAAWWSVVNWPAIEERYRAATAGTLTI